MDHTVSNMTQGFSISMVSQHYFNYAAYCFYRKTFCTETTPHALLLPSRFSSTSQLLFIFCCSKSNIKTENN